MPALSTAKLLTVTLAVGICFEVTTMRTSGEGQEPSVGVLDEHPSIQYATRPTTDRLVKLDQALGDGQRSFAREPQTGYLLPLLQALGVPAESQLLVFSKTGVQRAYTSPRTPRALYYDESVAIGYVPGAPEIELATQDPQQGVIFYTLNQSDSKPRLTRRTSCLGCHVSASTMYVPGLIARSNTVGEDGNVLPRFGSYDVTHRTPHPDRWGGWFVTSEGAAAPYGQRAHAGNITVEGRGNTSNQIFIDWLNSSPETRGYPSFSSDIVSLLTFDHQVHAINLLTRLNWESRVASSSGEKTGLDSDLDDLVNELADYLLFVGEAPISVPLTPNPAFARHLESQAPRDSRGRSCGQLDLTDHLFRYPCSYLIYSDAFKALPDSARRPVFDRMLDILKGKDSASKYSRLSPEDRSAVLEILKETNPVTLPWARLGSPPSPLRAFQSNESPTARNARVR